MLSLITCTEIPSWHQLAEYFLVDESKKLQPTELNTALAGSEAKEEMKGRRRGLTPDGN